MLISLPYIYTASVLPRRARRHRDAIFGAHAEVEVREIDAQDAPVALRWQPRRDGGRPQPEEGACMTRWDGDSHWHPVLIRRADGDMTMRHATPDEWAAVMARDTLDALAMPLGSSAPGFNSSAALADFVRGHVTALDETEFREIGCSTAEHKAEHLQEECGRLAIIDGMMWACGREPCYFAYPHDGRVVMRITGWNRRLGQDYFSLDRYDDMLDHLRAVYPESEILACPPAEVMIPQSLSQGDDAEALVAAAGKLVRHGHDLTRDAPLEEALAWFTLRDAYNRCMSEGGVCAGLDEQMEKFAEAFADDGYVAATAAAALDRWRLRPIQEGDAFAP